jgi:hypothetical protein
MSRTIAWHPIPAPTSAPVTGFVELLWGHPEQK